MCSASQPYSFMGADDLRINISFVNRLLLGGFYECMEFSICRALLMFFQAL